MVAIDLSKQELDDEHTSILFPLHVKLPANDVDTGYGAPFRDGQGADHFVTLAERAGFEVVSRRDEAGWFFLEVKKKAREPIRPAAP